MSIIAFTVLYSLYNKRLKGFSFNNSLLISDQSVKKRADYEDLNKHTSNSGKILQNIFSDSDIVAIQLNSSGEITWVNKRFTKLVGQDLELMYQRKNIYLSSFFSTEHLESIIPEILKNKNEVNTKLHCFDINQKERWFASNFKPVLNNKNKIEYIICLCNEITDTILTARELKNSERKFRAIYEHSNDAIFLMDGAKFIDCNPKTEEIFGASKNEILGKTPVDFSPTTQPDGSLSNDKVHYYINEAFNDVPQKFEWLHARGERTTFMANITLTPIYYEGKKLLHAIVKDITADKKSNLLDSALNKVSTAFLRERNLTTLYKTIHSIVQECMAARNFYIALYDKEKNEVTFPYFIDEYDTAPLPRIGGTGLTEYIIRTGKPALLTTPDILQLQEEGKVNILGSDSIDWLGVPLKSEENIIGMAAVQSYKDNIRYTENDKDVLTFISSHVAIAIGKKSYEKKLRESEQKLKELNANKDKLFSIIAHDLKSPLTALMGFSEMIAKDFESFTNEEVKLFVGSIAQSANTIHSLIINLLDWSRFQSNRLTPIPKSIKLHETANEVTSLFSRNLETKRITVVNSINDKIIVYADNYMLSGVFRNLLSNAIKFSNYDSNIIIKAGTSENKAKITIKDFGVGIPEKEISKLFNPNDYYSSIGTNNEKGSGLGLMITKELVQKNGGEITVTSKLGEGTEFTFSVPLQNNF